MGGIYRRKNSQAKNKKFHRLHKTKAYGRDTDQIYDDMKPENYDASKQKPVDETLPNLGQSYCVACARYFVSDNALQIHEQSKRHKQAVKRLKEEPYTHKELEQIKY